MYSTFALCTYVYVLTSDCNFMELCYIYIRYSSADASVIFYIASLAFVNVFWVYLRRIAVARKRESRA